MIREIPIALMRGGTVKAIIIKEDDLPKDREQWDKIFLCMIGSTYDEQIDGLGARDPNITKLAVIRKSQDPDIDVEYRFFQIGIGKKIVNSRGMCGNIPSAIGIFCIEEGFVRPKAPITPVIVRNLNTGKIIKVEVPVKDKKVRIEGTYELYGVRGTGARINVTFFDIQGPLTGRLFPSGNRKDILLDGIPVSIIDSGILTVFIEARYLGLRGIELPEAIEKNEEIIGKIERIRTEVADLIDFDPDIFFPKFAYITTPKNYTTIFGKNIKENDIDIVARYFSQRGIIHHSFPVTGGIALSSASLLEGTVVSEIFHSRDGKIRIGHPSGVVELNSSIKEEKGGFRINSKISRTARKISSGVTYVVL